MIKVESGIPLPENGTKKANVVYPFEDMNVGDSFTYILDTPHREYLVRNAAYKYGSAHSKKFACRLTAKDGQKAIGCWRTE